MKPVRRFYTTRTFWWAVALLAVGLLLVSRVPAIAGLIGVVVLAMMWCWQLDAESSRAAVTRRPIGDDRDLHVAGERHDPLHQAATKEA
jgi:hypothetical protein